MKKMRKILKLVRLLKILLLFLVMTFMLLPTFATEDQSFEKSSQQRVLVQTQPDIIVNITSDLADFDGSKQVGDLPGPDKVVSLRESLIAANNTPGPQVIWFNIPTTDSGFDGKVFTIKPLRHLPSLLDNGTTIDGTSQTDFTGDTNLFGPEIVLDGGNTEDDCVGIGISGSDNHTIRGLVIHSFNCTGIQFFEDPYDFNHPNNVKISQCYIGTDETGSLAKGNGWQGIAMNGSDHIIGGPNPEDGNLISNNNLSEIGIGGYDIVSSNTLVQGNLIGTDRTGMAALGKTVGVALCNAKNCLVIGNLISGNEIGVMVERSNAEGNRIEENLIGTDITGEIPLPNKEQGISFNFGSSNNIVTGNRIAFNNNCGIMVGSNSTRNTISRNLIFSNAELGIDLGFNGITHNDIDDVDSGANNLQNFPVLNYALVTLGSLDVNGTIDTPNPETITIEFFTAEPGGDPLGHGEGAVFLGTVMPNKEGKFTATLRALSVGTLITATATDADGNTSEFAKNIEAKFLEITLNRNKLYFGYEIGGNLPASQIFNISSSAGGTLTWSVSDNQNWMSCTPTTGTGPGTVSVSLDPTGLVAGIYDGTISISNPNASNSPQTIDVTLKVYASGTSSEPFGEFSTPVDGSTVSSSIPVTGWVLDDIGIENLKIYRGSGNNLVYIGDAVFVEGARPDIEQTYPDYPMNYKAGWGYMMLTSFLPPDGNGTFNIHAIATDVEGKSTTLGTKAIHVDNANAVKPFGAIDTPTQGGSASGAGFRNQGWVLTPMPNTIPTDGSTIFVYVDGVSLDNPTYNVYRSDIASLFPGYANSDGAHAYFDFDTTAYDNGVHSIYWTAEDDAGNADGIGSRFFSVQNAGSSGSRGAKTQKSSYNLPRINELPVSINEAVEVRCGFRKDIEPRLIFPDEKGMSIISIKELELLEIKLSNPTAGFIVAGNKLYPLPVGSTLDTKKNIFSWIPGPGFVGDYKLVFIEHDLNGELSKWVVVVKIAPKYGLN